MKILALVYVYFWLCWQFVAPKEPEPNFVQIDCRIYDQAGVLVATYPGFTCAFAKNGEWLSLDANKLSLFDTSNQLKYTFPYSVHHELRFSRDEQKIYFLSEEIRKYKGLDTRFDVLNVADKNGKLLYSWHTADHIDEMVEKLDLKNLLKVLPFPITSKMRYIPANYEFSHLNAISEIPPNPYEYIIPYLKRGNLLVTFNGLGAFVIFDPTLSRIEHVFEEYVEIEDYGFHDAQILTNGHLIFFKNINDPKGETYTSLDEYDILFRKRIWKLKLDPPDFGLNPINGTVQVLNNNNVFISESSHGGRVAELTRSGEVQWSLFNQRTDETTKLPVQVYRGRKINGDKFFQNNITGATIK